MLLIVCVLFTFINLSISIDGLGFVLMFCLISFVFWVNRAFLLAIFLSKYWPMDRSPLPGEFNGRGILTMLR